MERKEERKMRKREHTDNRKNNHKRGEIYECFHNRYTVTSKSDALLGVW
jgi:hypothetical protein